MTTTNPALMPEQKYSKDGEFREPVLRCDGCAELVLLADLHRIGMCPHCSNTRVKNARTVNETEMAQLEKWAADGVIDPDFIKLFAPDVPSAADAISPEWSADDNMGGNA